MFAKSKVLWAYTIRVLMCEPMNIALLATSTLIHFVGHVIHSGRYLSFWTPLLGLSFLVAELSSLASKRTRYRDEIVLSQGVFLVSTEKSITPGLTFVLSMVTIIPFHSRVYPWIIRCLTRRASLQISMVIVFYSFFLPTCLWIMHALITSAMCISISHYFFILVLVLIPERRFSSFHLIGFVGCP